MERTAGRTGIPALEGIAELVAVFDALAARRPPGDPPLPVVLFRGDRADELVLGLRDRLRTSAGEPTVPHVVVRGRRRRDHPDDDIAFLDQVANEVARAAPAGMGRIDLPSYWTVRDILDLPTHRRSYEEQRRELRDRLHARGRQARPVVDWLDRVVTGVAANRAVEVVQTLLRPVAIDLPRLVFGRRLARGRRLRWFSEQIARVTGRGGDDVLAAALAVTRDGPERGNEALVRRLLVLALRRDVDAAFRPSLVSWQKRRRLSPLVVLLTDVRAGDPGHHLLDTLVALADELPRGTMLVVAGLAAEAELPPAVGPGGPELRLERAAEVLGPLAGRGRAVDTPVLVVTAGADSGGGTGGSEDERAASWLAVNQKVQPALPRLPVAVPALTIVLSLLALLLVPVAFWAVAVDGGGGDRCAGITRPASGREWVGVGDGTAACTFFPEPRGELERRQREVERDISAENGRVLAAADQGLPYATLVFFAPLTVPDQPERLGQTSLRQLRGVALAQAEANRQARTDQNKARVRVLLANPGDRFAHGPEVARQISAEARRDDTLVGVVGIAQSRSSSREAIGILAEQNLPVVAGPVTGDAMIESSPYYYQVSPRNERVARVLVAFATSTPIAGSGDDLRPARRAVIVKDHSDEYSQNLADDIRRSFEAAGHRTIRTFSYAVEDPSLPMPAPDPANQEVRVPSLDQLAHDVCTSLGRDPDVVVFFTSRAQQLAGMLNSMRSDPACTGRITVVGGTDITKFVQNPDVDLQRYPFLRLFYGAFASPVLQESNAARQFVADYTAVYGDADIAVDVSDPALTYDAFFAMQEAVNQASQGRLSLTPDTVAAKLADGEVDIDGATGYIHFDGALDIHRVPRDKPVLVLEASAAPSVPLLSCGHLASAVNRTTWGPGDRFPCPRDTP
jgi:ABC-type branched-subunit amino acid transport system substrate-binding protein